MFVFSPVSCNGQLCLLWQGFVPGLLRGQYGVSVGQCQQSDQMPVLSAYARVAGKPNCIVLFLGHPLKGFNLWARSVVRSNVCTQSFCWGYSEHKLEGPLPVLALKKILLVGRAGSRIMCLPHSICWGCRQIGVCGFLLLSPGKKSLWTVACPSWICLQDVPQQKPLWKDACQVACIGLGRFIEQKGRAQGFTKVDEGCFHWLLQVMGL